MSFLTSVLSVLIMTSHFAQACPKLEGKYKCEGGSWPGGYFLEIERQQSNGSTQFVMTAIDMRGSKGMSEVYIADGQLYDYGGIQVVSTCTDKALSVRDSLGSLSAGTRYSLDANKDLKIFTRNFIFPSWETCSRVK